MTDVQTPPSEAPDPQPDDRSARRTRAAVEWVVLIGAALVIAFLIKTFLFQAFYIPSASMVPTLEVGDRVLVNKLSYKLHDVNRGDIVVFEAPPEAAAGNIKDLVKRVIGLPGDTVEARDGRVYINGRLLDEPYLPAGTRTVIGDVPPGCVVPTAQQDLPTAEQAGCKVPPGHMFVMGDNREQSRDSHIFGPVKESTIVGRVFVRIWPPGSVGLL
ncbi:MAG: signal peptidase I [Acidimicrobiia bacterium]